MKGTIRPNSAATIGTYGTRTNVAVTNAAKPPSARLNTTTALGVVFTPERSMRRASHEPADVCATRRSTAGSGP